MVALALRPSSPVRERHPAITFPRDGTEQAGPDERGTPDSRPEVGSSMGGPDLVAEQQIRFAVPVLLDVLTKRLDQPTWQRHRPTTGSRFGVTLESGVPGHLDDGADPPQPAGVQVDGVGAQAGGLTPAQARSAGHRDDAPIAMRNGGQQLVSERHTGDD